MLGLKGLSIDFTINYIDNLSEELEVVNSKIKTGKFTIATFKPNSNLTFHEVDNLITRREEIKAELHSAFRSLMAKHKKEETL